MCVTRVRQLLFRYGQRHQNVPTPDLCAAFADLTGLRIAEVKNTTFFLDTRPATDPESRGFSHHTGLHPKIMYHVVSWGVRMNWFKDVRTSLHNATVGLDLGEFNLVCYCRSGKHRAVACAALLYETLRMTRRYTPSAPAAFIHWNDLAKCKGAPECSQCSHNTHQRVRKACAMVWDNWGRSASGSASAGTG